jgi:hypothetical protein
LICSALWVFTINEDSSFPSLMALLGQATLAIRRPGCKVSFCFSMRRIISCWCSTIFINRFLFLMRTWKQSSKMKIFVYLKWHYWITNSKNLFVVRKDFVCVKKRVINIEY